MTKLFSTIRGSEGPNLDTAQMELSLGHPLPRMVLNVASFMRGQLLMN